MTRLPSQLSLQPLGSGQYGEAYRYREMATGRVVAVKLLPRVLNMSAERKERVWLEREVREGSQVCTPCSVPRHASAQRSSTAPTTLLAT